jgi:DNA-binding PadR family transcriptional regulator
MHRHRRHLRRQMRAHGMGLRGRFFGPGEVRLALLALIVEQPRHGYELMRELEARSAGVYRASAGSVYPTLQQLEDEGLVHSESLEGKRVYRVTDAGRGEADEEEDAIRRIWRRAERWGDWGDAFHPEAMEIERPSGAERVPRRLARGRRPRPGARRPGARPPRDRRTQRPPARRRRRPRQGRGSRLSLGRRGPCQFGASAGRTCSISTSRFLRYSAAWA